MQEPMEIVWRGVEKSEPIEDLIRTKVGKLEQVCDHIIRLRAAIEKDQKHQTRGNPFRVRLDMFVPPKHEIVVTRESSTGDMHDELPTVVRSAFEAARRRLKKITEKQQGQTKSHPDQEAGGLVEKLFPEQDYGFLRSLDGREIYFHRNAVTEDDFDRLTEGASVAYTAKVGEQGLTATTVHLVDRS